MASTSFPKRASTPPPMRGPHDPPPGNKPFSTKAAKPVDRPGPKKGC